MKKISVLAFVLVLATATTTFARDKIGGLVGFPIGMSYSHEFSSNNIELDLLVFYNGFNINSSWFGRGGLGVDIGPLWRVADGNIDGSRCPFLVGPIVGVNFDLLSLGTARAIYGGVDLYCALRWEIFPKTVANFAFFFEFSPGLTTYFYDRGGIEKQFAFTTRGGLGLRYCIN